MCNNIKEKALGVRSRRVILVLLLIISILTMVACDSKESQVTTQEFELVSCFIEFRNETNGFGGITRTDKYLHYGYINEEGKVTFDEKYFDYGEYELTEETPKVSIKTSKSETTYTFYLTREMYENINTSQK